MSVTQIQSNGKDFIEKNKDSFVILVFDGEFTGQATLVQGAIEALVDCQDLANKIVVGSVDVENNNDLATELAILSVPMIVCLVKGKVVKKVDTFEPSKLVKTIKEELAKQSLSTVSDGDKELDPKDRLKEYLKKLTNRAQIMIFMKGAPEAPRCGFSKQLIALLSKYNAKYDTFDILQDEDVRQGLKEYSDWQTYPQIYVKGEFIGGLDVLKQLDETGELASTLGV